MYTFEKMTRANNAIDEIKRNLAAAEKQSYGEIQVIKHRLEEAQAEAEQVKEEMSKKKSYMIETLSYDPAAVYIIGMCNAFTMTSNNAPLNIIATFIINYINGTISELEFHTVLAMELTSCIQTMLKENNNELIKYKEEIYEFIDNIITIAAIDKMEGINTTSNLIINDIMETLSHIMVWVD